MAYLQFNLDEFWLPPGCRANKSEHWLCRVQMTAYLTISYRDKESGEVKKKRKQVCNFMALVRENNNYKNDIVAKFLAVWEQRRDCDAGVYESDLNQFWLVYRQITLEDKMLLWKISADELKNKFHKKVTEYRDSLPDRIIQQKKFAKSEAHRKTIRAYEEIERIGYDAYREKELEEARIIGLLSKRF